MILVRLTYFSRNRIDPRRGSMHDRVLEILSASVANNRRDGITGALIYDSKWFAQVLEGTEGAVSRTFERILRDERHSDVSLVAMQPMTERLFGMCPMMSIAREADNSHLFRHYGESERFDPPLMRPDRLFDLVEALVSRSLEGHATSAA